MFFDSSSGEKTSCPIANRITPTLSRYSAPPIISRIVPDISLTIVPVFALGINPLGPSIRPSPALLSFCTESM